jgi:hypothetical protein
MYLLYLDTLFLLTYQLETRIEDGPCASKIEDLTSNHVNASVIGSVQLENHRGEFFWVVDLLGTGQNCGCFAGTRGAIKQLKRRR